MVSEGAAVNGAVLQPQGSSWLECIRGIMGSNIIRHTHKHTHRHTEDPSVPQLEGKIWGDYWESVALWLSSLGLCPLLWIYTSVHVHVHRNRDCLYPVKSNPHTHQQCTHNCRYRWVQTHASAPWPVCAVVSDWCVFWHRGSEIAPHAQRHAAPHKALCLGGLQHVSFQSATPNVQDIRRKANFIHFHVVLPLEIRWCGAAGE